MRPTRSNHYNWKGGKTIISGYPYILDPSHPNAEKHGYVRENRFIMSKHLGRPLGNNEIVHHIDNNPMNNDIDNLKLVTKNTHRNYHIKLKPIVCDGCGGTFQPIRKKTLNRKYCSWKCWVNTPKQPILTCTFCGISYRPIRKPQKSQYFCSKKCADKYRRKRIKITCDNCKALYLPRRVKKPGEKNFCCRKCYISDRFY